MVLDAPQLEQISEGEQLGGELELHVGRPPRFAHGGHGDFGSLVESIQLPQGKSLGEVGRGEQFGAAICGGDGERLRCQLLAPCRVVAGDEHGRQHAAHPHLVAAIAVRQRGDRQLHQLDQLWVGGAADVEADA